MFPISYSENLSQPDTPDTAVCPLCNIKMDEGHTTWSCGECGYQVDKWPETEFEYE